jgi:serine/threonine-protein kinase
MELVPGETLAERIARGPLRVEECLGIFRQIAEALEAAHEKGIIHRDLKPANIIVSSDGRVKVLDFGLAKSVEVDGQLSDLSKSPTRTREGTEHGIILGTAAYMSPEQARGTPVDKRSDIWAFGVVLFEMLTGKQLFRGETASDTLAAVLKTEPNWNLLPTETPVRVRELLRRCLTRDPHERLRDIGEARVALSAVGGAGPQAGAAHSVSKAVLIAAALGVAAGAAALWRIGLGHNTAVEARTVSRFSLSLPSDAPFWLDQFNNSNLSISRDGHRVVYGAGKRIGPDGRQIYLRRLDDLNIRALPETDDACSQFFSPDGTWIAYFSVDGMLKKVSLAGGRPVILARDLSNTDWMMGSWSDDGRIVFDSYDAGLRVVPAAGGSVTTLSTPSGEWHLDPQVLPESDEVLYTVQAVSKIRIESISLDGKNRKTILENASHARYLASGHLLFMRDGGLMVVPFDRNRVEITGPARSVPLEVTVDHPNLSAPVPQMAIALDGTLVYVPGSAESQRTSTLVWVDRRGSVEEQGPVPFAVPHFNLSPDGERIAVTGRDAGKAYVDLYDLSRKTSTRFLERDVDYPTGAIFSVDGRRMFFGRWDTQRSELWWQPVDGSGGPERVLSVPGLWLSPWSVSPDGRFLTFNVSDVSSSTDVWVADLEATTEPRARPFVATPDIEFSAVFAPDGRAIAYSSNESGQWNIYIRRFPEGDRKVRVSVEGGLYPQWSRDGRELFYQSPDGSKLMTVSVQKNNGLSFDDPRVLFEGPYLRSLAEGLSYAVSPDASRFLMVRKPNVHPLRSFELVVVQNWFEEIKQLVPTNK